VSIRACAAFSCAAGLTLLGAMACTGGSDETGAPGTSTVGGSGGSVLSCSADGGSGGGAGGTDVRPLGDLTGPWQLFVDDYLVEEQSNVTRSYHPFEKYAANPVMTADKPWEDTYVYLYGRVMPDEGGAGYRMWYSALDFHDPTGSSRVLYATSTDGIVWDKPNLGIRQWNGNADNNMFIPRDRPNHIMSVMHTPWDPDPACQYRLINFDGAYDAWPAGYDAACSADGIHLADLPNNPVIDATAVGVGDVAQFTWDPWGKRYLGYVKVAVDDQGLRRRTVGLSATADFASWPSAAPPVVLQPDALDDAWAIQAGLDLATNRTHFYGVSVFPYQTMFIGLLWIFRASDPPNCGHDCEPTAGYIFGTIHVELASSRDGVSWTREQGDAAAGRPATLALGAEGEWDSMMLFTANDPLLEDGEIKLYYGGCDENHGSIGTNGSAAIGLATLRKDGFASLDAAASTGTVTTKALAGMNGELHVNANVASGGALAVEVLDDAGQVIPGYGAADCQPLTEDSLDAVVRWGSRTALPAYPCALRLRFVLQDAALYSFMAGSALRLAS
jgi:hypothetical protein